MEVSLMKKTTILYIFLTALLLWTSFAGGRMRYDSKTAMDAGINVKETSEKATPSDQQASTVHDRLLRANTKDYGSYDPAPALGKPLSSSSPTDTLVDFYLAHRPPAMNIVQL